MVREIRKPQIWALSCRFAPCDVSLHTHRVRYAQAVSRCAQTAALLICGLALASAIDIPIVWKIPSSMKPYDTYFIQVGDSMTFNWQGFHGVYKLTSSAPRLPPASRQAHFLKAAFLFLYGFVSLWVLASAVKTPSGLMACLDSFDSKFVILRR